METASMSRHSTALGCVSRWTAGWTCSTHVQPVQVTNFHRCLSSSRPGTRCQRENWFFLLSAHAVPMRWRAASNRSQDPPSPQFCLGCGHSASSGENRAAEIPKRSSLRYTVPLQRPPLPSRDHCLRTDKCSSFPGSVIMGLSDADQN